MLRMRKRFEVVRRGIGLVIGYATFPTWNIYPGLLAWLATGNPVIVKPHPNAVLTVALTVAALREVLVEQGLPADIVSLALCPDAADTQALATNPAVASIHFTGSTQFDHWLIQHARQAKVCAEMAGVNTVIIESTSDDSGLIKNLAFTLSLYSGQMCTTTQNLLVPKHGIATDQGHKSFERVGEDLAAGIDALLADLRVASAVLGVACALETLKRLSVRPGKGRTVLASGSVPHPQFGSAQLYAPAIVALSRESIAVYGEECFGPVSFLIAADSGTDALVLAKSTLKTHGALTLGANSTNPAYVDQAIRRSALVDVPVSPCPST